MSLHRAILGAVFVFVKRGIPVLFLKKKRSEKNFFPVFIKNETEIVENKTQKHQLF